MSLDTYENLKTEIGSWLDRDDLSAYLDTFIDLCEEQLFHDLRVREIQVRESISTTARFISVPSGFLEAISMNITVSGAIARVQYVSPEQLNNFNNSTSGQPVYFSVVGSQIGFDRTPDSSYSGELVCYEKFTALSSSNTTNSILTNYPGAYLYGSLSAAEPFLGNDERLVVWKTLYAEHVAKANNTTKQTSRSALSARSDNYAY